MWKRSGHYKFPILVKGAQFYYVNYLWQTKGNIYQETPHHLYVTTDHQCKEKLSESIKVLHNNINDKKLKFGVCLHQPLFGEISVQEVVDWIIIHETLGVEIIYIYIEMKFYSEVLVQALNPFVNSGLLEIIDWSLGIETATFGQRAVINDCLYRSMNKVEFLALYDLDEILVPRNHLTWPELIEEIKAKVNISQVASLSLNVRQWHDDGVPLINNTGSDGYTLPVYLRRTQLVKTTFYFRSLSKPMVRPNFVDMCSVHGAKQIRSKKVEYKVPQDVATVHHYRHTERPFISSSYDPVMRKYADEVMMRRRRFIKNRPMMQIKSMI